ncbi:Hypothetical protein CAP_2121 [Chondromyces apiculatus DSM 436]|uniref:Uncharacterized protein n=1 Tax=Chondromyces apiculatus DSM 436 TaxID=1192034 RepID=A0A017TAD0_9BACT|nr:Hypothetical protein CAP_2121 [Chondromyces apiculatus DSM 436]
MLIGGAILVLASSIFGTVMFLRVAEGGAYTVPVESSMPLALGDKLAMRMGRDSCNVNVLGLVPDGRVLGVGCGESAPAPLARKSLNARTSVYFQGGTAKGDVVLVNHAGAWSRAEVLGLAPERNVQVRVLEAEAIEPVVDQRSLVIVQRASDAIEQGIDVPLPVDAPVLAGDMLALPQGSGGTVPVRIEAVTGDTVRVQRGRGALAGFTPEASPPSEEPRSALWVRAARTIDAIPAGTVVLGREGSAWVRSTVLGPEKDRKVRIKRVDGGAEEVRPQQDLLLLRSGGQGP